MKLGGLVLGLGLWVVIGLVVAAPGCGRPTPPVVPTPTDPEPEEPRVDEPGDPEEEPAAEPEPEPVEPAPQAATPPTIPDAPVSGTLDGEPLVLASVTMINSVLTLADEGGRTVAIVIFDRAAGTIDLTSGAIPFGSPHVVVRTGADNPTKNYTDGYRLLLELGDEGGRIWLELPDERGMLSGTFDQE